MFSKTLGTLLTLLVYIHITHSQNKQTKRSFQFEDFTKKFEPSFIWEQIDKQASPNKANLSNAAHTETMMRAIDPTDELLSFKVENGNADIINSADGRRGGWIAPKHLYSKMDPFSYRRRLLELMKQAIYQTRNRLIQMQELRRVYKTSPLYKMGFLFSKTDSDCKTFTLFSFRAFRLCMLKRMHMVYKYTLYTGLQSNERQLQQWFNIELLVELIKKNDDKCKKVLRTNTTDRKLAWKFID